MWVSSDDDPRLRIAEGEKVSRGVMVTRDVSKCGIGKLVFDDNDRVIDGNAYGKTARRDVIPDIRFKMRARPKPHAWWRQQDFAPAHAAKPVEQPLANKSLVQNVLPRMPNGTGMSLWTSLFWDIWMRSLTSTVARTLCLGRRSCGRHCS